MDDEIEEGTIGYGVFCSLSFHPVNGLLRILHAANGSLRYASSSGSTWTATVVGEGSGSSLLHDASGTPHISSVKGGILTHFWHDGTDWQSETVASSPASGRTVIRMNGTRPAICYKPGVRYAHK